MINQALLCYQKGQYTQALELIIAALKQQSNNAELWNLAGLCMCDLGEFNKAIAYFLEARRCDGSNVAIQINLAQAYCKDSQLSQCIELLVQLQKKAKKSPFYPTLLFNLAQAYEKNHQSNLAISCYQSLLKISPNDHQARFLLANLLLSTNPKQALRLYLFLLENNPSQKIAISMQMAIAYNLLDHLPKALELYEMLLKTNHSAMLWFNYANALNYHLQFDEALNAYKQSLALEFSAKAALNLSFLLLRLGRFDEAWEFYESRLSFVGKEKFLEQDYKQCLQAFRAHRAGMFDGKVVVVYCEQGFGDTIMFSRFLAPLKKRAKTLIFIPQKELWPIFSHFHLNKSLPDEYDFALPIGSLPFFLDLDLVKEHLATLLAKSVLAQSFQSLPKRPIQNIALFWEGNPKFAHSKAKSYPITKLWKHLRSLPFCFYIFQPNCSVHLEGAHDVARDFVHFGDTLEALKKIDLVISSDSALAHLALSVGVQTIVLLPKRFDWRFGSYESPVSPWYPKAILLAQKQMGKWDDVFAELVGILKEKI